MATGVWSWRTRHPLGPPEPRSESLTSDPYQPNPCAQSRDQFLAVEQTLAEEKSHGLGLAAPRRDPDVSPAFGQALGSGESGVSPLARRETAGPEAGQPSSCEGLGGARGPPLPHMARARAPHLAEAEARGVCFCQF